MQAMPAPEAAFGPGRTKKDSARMFEAFYEAAANAASTITRHAAELDRPVIGVMPAYFPMELVYAAGGFPVQLWGNNLGIEKADAYLQSYCCSVARSVLELELRGSAPMVRGYAFTSLCDTLINLREIYRRLFDKPTIELSIPITRTRSARQNYLQHVVQKVTADLEAVTGRRISNASLQEAAQLYGAVRRQQRELYRLRRQRPGLISNRDFYTVLKAGFFLPPAVYRELLTELAAELGRLSAKEQRRTKLLATGMVFDPLAIHAILDEAGVDIVDDDFANGWRTAAKADLQTDDLLGGVTDFLFAHAPCCCIYDSANDRHAYLVDKVRTSGADGVLFWYVKFCEPDAFDRPQLMQRLADEGIPATVVDLELSMTNFDAIRTRINAFCEILEG
jgi:bcr-type benzoyl-CoA reductase subunit C